MTKEELEKEAEKWLRKFLLCNDCKRKCHCIELNAYCEEQVLKAYIDSAEPREKRIAELEKENAELKEALEGYKKIAKWCDKCDKIAELKLENQKWKDEWQEQVQKATDEGYARTLQTIQLNKAKEILQEFVDWATWQGNSKCPSFKSIQDKAEQFLKEIK